jgi:hypothetical protein
VDRARFHDRVVAPRAPIDPARYAKLVPTGSPCAIATGAGGAAVKMSQHAAGEMPLSKKA